MNYYQKMRAILERRPFPLAEAVALSAEIQTAEDSGTELTQHEERQWAKLTEEILRHTPKANL